MIDTKELNTETDGNGKDASDALVHLTEVSHTYRSAGGCVEAIEDINLTVSKGDRCLITGPSGSGKTTLMMILSGLLRPTAGDVRLFGQDRVTSRDHRYRSQLRAGKIGFMLPSFQLLPYLSASENLQLAFSSRGTQPQERIDMLLEAVALSDRRDHRPQQLSTGEQRRLMLCRALVNEPCLLICDEPVANLDQPNAKLLSEIIADYSSAERAVLVVSHHMHDQFRPTTRYVMQSGRLSRPNR